MTEPFLGSVQYFAFNYAPVGWNQCNGQILNITQYQALFALLGTNYGGDGRVTFGLPDLRGRTIVGFGHNVANHPQPTTYNLGQKAGVESVTMTTNKMPANNLGGGLDTPAGAFPSINSNTGENQYASTAGTNQFMGTPQVSVSVAGSSTPFSNLSPYLTLNACIAVTGYFPSRN
jgi:microcystin-dependent protein